MKRFLFTIAIAIVAGLMQIGCNSGNKNGGADTAVADSSLNEEPANDYSSLVFKSADEVRAFLDFRKFEDAHGYIAFNGKGGVIDGESFTTTDIELKSDKKAVISINIPKMNLSGKYLLQVADTQVTLEDEENHNIYKLNEDKK